jgi:hypothetical protein
MPLYFVAQVEPSLERAAMQAIERAGGGWIAGRTPGLLLSDKNVQDLGVDAEVEVLTEAEAAQAVEPDDVYGGCWAGTRASYAP